MFPSHRVKSLLHGAGMDGNYAACIRRYAMSHDYDVQLLDSCKFDNTVRMVHRVNPVSLGQLEKDSPLLRRAMAIAGEVDQEEFETEMAELAA